MAKSEGENPGQLGDAAYDAVMDPATEDAHLGEQISIDVDSRDFEISESHIAAVDGLRLRRPDARVWTTRVGSRYAFTPGFRLDPLHQ